MKINGYALLQAAAALCAALVLTGCSLQALVEQLRQTAGEVVRTTLDAVPGLVGKVLLYVVLALAVLIGGPFALGFWLGGVRARAGAKRKE